MQLLMNIQALGKLVISDNNQGRVALVDCRKIETYLFHCSQWKPWLSLTSSLA